MFKTAIILAGGKSTRMGEDKAFLPFGDRPMLLRVIDEIRPHFDDLILVTNQPEQHLDLEDIRLVSDVHPGQGPLGGLFTGLLASRGRHNLVVGGDYPFLNHLLLDFLWSLRTWGDVVVPLTHEALAPICAIYDRRILPTMVEALEAGERSVMGMFPLLKVHYVREDELLPYDPQLLSFRNVNTPEDYRQALSELGKVEEEGT